MTLQGLTKDIFTWAQSQIPTLMGVRKSATEDEIYGTIPATSGDLHLRLLFSDRDNSFFFSAIRPEGDKTSLHIEINGYWPADRETLASVLASIPPRTK